MAFPDVYMAEQKKDRPNDFLMRLYGHPATLISKCCIVLRKRDVQPPGCLPANPCVGRSEKSLRKT